MTSSEIRQSFLDFFKSKQHTIVPSSSLLPDSPNLLFTNAGMNQFVPIFLGERKADVSKWAGAIPGRDTRAADTQKCIRAGGKHNDLEDVGLDTYHHTFFEMLGNWSFGDYFKKEAIDWAWELITGVWKFPANRLYATVYNPDKSKNDPSEFDQEAWDVWAGHFRKAGLDPKVHIVNGNKKDNFWMMGDTGPCGPCSELHVDLTPAGDTKGSLVNKGDARCIEIWNLVFIQFNANQDGTFSPLPAKHVDTGMGFERVTSIIQGTKNFSDFQNAKISNYETDIFRPIFDEIEKLSGKKYTSTLPKPGSTGDTEQEKIDVAFRVIADHIRTLSFAIADGILPGNNDRNYVLRRILRRAVRYGRTLGFHEPFFYKLVDVLADKMGNVFPEIRTKKQNVKHVLKLEEESFNKTLDRGVILFDEYFLAVNQAAQILRKEPSGFLNPSIAKILLRKFRKIPGFSSAYNDPIEITTTLERDRVHDFLQAVAFRNAFGHIKDDLIASTRTIDSQFAFELYDTYGFPLDLTQLMAREVGLKVDIEDVNLLMEEQRERARKAQKKTVITLSDEYPSTEFVGFDNIEINASLLMVEFQMQTNSHYAILDQSPFYAEMGGQCGDSGTIVRNGGRVIRISNTVKRGNVFYHELAPENGAMLASQDAFTPVGGEQILARVDHNRRAAIERHHTVTHLLHWALHEVVSKDATQKGSSVGPDKLTFDFNSAALTPQQIADIEKHVNQRVRENAPVAWGDFPYADVKGRADVMQFFGDKYGDVVRVVQIGGTAKKDAHGKDHPLLDGYSMELCGGTHVRRTGDIGLFKILRESAIAAGVRRIEAVAGDAAVAAVSQLAQEVSDLEKALAGAGGKIPTTTIALPTGTPDIATAQALEQRVHELKHALAELRAAAEKAKRAELQKNAAGLADDLAASAITHGALKFIVSVVDAPAASLRDIAVQAGKKMGPGVVVLGCAAEGKAGVVALCSPEAIAAGHLAGKIVGDLCAQLGGKGGGKPDFAQGGGKEAAQLPAVLDAFLKQTR
jgi:alanyl-tRNA synthetase